MQKINLVNYTNTFTFQTQSGYVESNCSGITFVNLGTDVCTVLGYPLQQFQAIEPPNQFAGGNDVTQYVVAFAGGAGLEKKLLIIRQILQGADL